MRLPTLPSGVPLAGQAVPVTEVPAPTFAGPPIITPVLVCNCDAFTTLEKAGYQAVTNSDAVITLGKSKSIQNRSRHCTGSVFCLEKTPSLPATLQFARIWKLCLNFYKNFQFNRAK
jgi:hypothetical protein